MEIVKAPSDVLSQVANPVSKVDKSILTLIEEMKVTLANTHDPEGVGLAAPQVGKSLQLFIIKPTKKATITVFINPVILVTQNEAWRHPGSGIDSGQRAQLSQARMTSPNESKDKKSSRKLEGCLSLTNIWGDVIRQREITISYLDETGKQKTKTFKGFSATIVQHEMDHLQGILFPKRVLEQKGILYKSKKNDKGEDVFEEIEI